MTLGSQKCQLRLSRRMWLLPLRFLAMIHCTLYQKGHMKPFSHSVTDQLMFGGCDKPNSFFKCNWAFGHNWLGENAHAGVGGKGLACQKAGRVCSCVKDLKF